MASIQDWVEGLRIRTLPAAVSPVIAATAVPASQGKINLPIVLLCLLVALLLQVGVNFSNDYSDGIRGTDSAQRVGPKRLVGSGAASPKAVLIAAMICYLLACLVGLAITIITGHYWYLLIGVGCVLAGWFYTGGKHPYGYLGFGEVFVFIFFGLVAVAGTAHAQLGQVSSASWLTAVSMGCLSCAILVCNNLRDIKTDLASGKLTLETKIGDRNSRVLFAVLILISMFCGFAVAEHTSWWALFFLLSLIFLAGPLKMIWGGTTGFALVKALKLTGLGQLVYAIGLLVGCLI